MENNDYETMDYGFENSSEFSSYGTDVYGDMIDPMEMDQDPANCEASDFPDDEFLDSDFEETDKKLPPDIAAGTTEHFVLHEYMNELRSQDISKLPDALQNCLNLEGYVWTVLSTRFSTYFRYYEDLYSEAMLAIIEYTPKYDPSRGKLTTFFDPYIMHAVCVWLDQFVMFSTPHYQMVETKINRVLRDHDMEDLDPTCVAKLTGLSTCTVTKVMRMKQMRHLSQARELSDKRYLSMVYDEAVPKFISPEDFVERSEEGEQLLGAVSVLSEKECNLVADYFGLGDHTAMKVTVMARKYKTTSYRVLKDLNQAIMKMQEYSKRNKKRKAMA